MDGLLRPPIPKSGISLRIRAVILLLLLLAGLIGLMVLLSQTILLPSFEDLEETQAREDTQRVLNVLDNDLATLSVLAEDWGNWDDTYQFAQDGNAAYIESNLVDETFVTLELDLLLIFDESNDLVYGKVYGWNQENSLVVSQELIEMYLSFGPLRQYFSGVQTAERTITGVIAAPPGLMLVGAHPILTSTGSGPSHGTLLMGRYLNEARIAEVAATTNHTIDVYTLDDPHLPDDVAAARDMLAPDKPVCVHSIDDDTLGGYALMTDINNNPVAVVRILVPRDMVHEGRATVQFFLIALAAGGLLIALGFLLLLERQVLVRVLRLNTAVRAISAGKHPRLDQRVPVVGRDELAALARSINMLLDSSQQAQQSLTESQLRIQQIISSISDVLYMAQMNADGEIVRHSIPSPQVADLTGYPSSRFQADWKAWQALILPDDRDHAQATRDRISKGHNQEAEYRIRDANGSIHWIRDSVHIDRQPDGSAVIYGVISDITARKQAEADLAAREQTAREFQERLKTLLRIGAELAQAPDLETLLRRAIELGRSELGFDRLGLYLLEDDGATMTGTFGIDTTGHLRDERRFRRAVADDPMAEQVLRDREWTRVWHDAPLYDEWEVVGRGWNAMASLWDGDETMGWLVADNLLSGAPLEAYQIELLSLYGTTIAQLITRKRAEQALRESEARYAALFHRMPIELYRSMPDGTLLDANAALVAMMGFDDLDQMRHSPTYEFYADPADRERWRQAIERAGELHDYEVRLRRRDGSTFWVHETSRTVYDEDGNVLFYEGHIRDVTAQREAEAALAAERNLLRTLIDALPDFIYARDTEGQFLLCNTAVMRLMGAASVDEVVGKTDADFYPPELAAQYAADDQIVLNGTPVLNRNEPVYRSPDETPIWVRTTKVPLRNADGEVIGLVGVGHDVTAERATAEALRENQERLNLALQAAGLGLWDWHVQTGEVVFNERWAEISGYTLEELGKVAGVWQTLVHPDDWPEVERRLYAHFEGRTPYFEAEYRMKTKDGTVKWILDRGKVVSRDADGAPLRMIGTLLDVSERRATERALRESQERLGLVVRGANLGTWDWAVQTGEMIINDRWAEMLGYSADEIEAHIRAWESIVHPDDRPDVLRLRAAHMAGETEFYEAEYRLRTKSGRWCWVQSRGKVVQRDSDGAPLRMSGTHLDITARKHADTERESLLRQTRSRAAELATVAEVSQQAAQILDINDLLWAACELVQENFGLYHVQVYLLESDKLRLAAGVGRVGRQMVAHDHAIPLDHQHSIVAQAARERKVVVVNDVTLSASFLPNVLLPETRSEIALPMLVGDRVIGVLDVQDKVTNRFAAQDIQIQATLAAQIGIAIYNAQLFSENARRLAIIEHSQDAIALTSLDTPGYFPVYLNPASLRILGYDTLDDVAEKTLAAFYPPEVYQRLRSDIMPEIRSQGSWRGELTVQHSDGTLIPVEQTFFLVYDEQGRPRDLATIMTDITARKQTDTALQRANRAYRVLSDCDQALIRAADQDSLLREVCHIVVRAGGYRMAWVGLVSDEHPTLVTPVAHAGHEDGYLEQIIQIRDQHPDVPGVSRRAILARKPLLISDIDTAPEFDLWRAKALSRGYRASIALPLMSEGRVLGTLNVYADQPDVFDQQEIALLVELADDLAYGIAALRTRRERQQVLQALEQRNRELLALHDVARTLTATLDEQAIYRLLFAQVVQPLFGAGSMTVARHDSAAGHLCCEFVIIDGKEQDPTILPPLPLGDGPNSTVLRTGKPLIVALPTRDHPDQPPGTFVHVGDEREPRSALYVPLISAGNVIGVLNIQHYDSDAFSESDIPLLTAAANQAMVAIRNARLFAAERQQRALSEALSDIAAAVNSTLDPDMVMERILENLRHVVPHDAASIMIIEDDIGRIVRHAGFAERGLADAVEALRLDASPNSPTLAGLRNGHPVLIDDVRTSDSWQHDPALNWMRSYVGVPIMLGEQIVGVLNLDSETPGFFTEQHVRRVQAFAEQVAIAIQNARLFAAEREQRALSEALSDTAAAVNSTLDPELVMDRILDNLRRVVPLDSASVMLIQGGEARIVRHTGFAERGLAEYVESLRFPAVQMTKFQQMETTGRPVRITDTQDAGEWVSSPELDWIRSYIGAPIMVGSRMVGVLNVDSAAPDFFTAQHAESLQAFADQVAIAIQNARLFAAETEQRRFAETLREIAATINMSLDQEAVLSAILASIRRVVPHDSATIMLIEDGTAGVVGAAGYEERGLQTTVMALEFRVDEQSAMQQIVETGETLIISDTTTDTRWTPSSGFEWVRSCVTAPIQAEGRVIGFLNLYSAQANFFTAKHAERLETFAYQASNAIRNARLFSVEHEQRALAETLRDTMAAINSSLDPDEVLAQLLHFVGRVVPHDAANIMLVQGDEATITHSHGYVERGYAEEVDNWRYPLAKVPLIARVVESGLPVLVSDTASDPKWDVTEMREAQWIRATLKAPIRLGEDVIGILNLDSATPHAFTPEHVRLLATFAAYAATAIRNARLFAGEREQRAMAEALGDTAAAILRTLDFDEVLEHVLENLGRVLPHDATNIILIDEAGMTNVAGHRGYAERGLEDWITTLHVNVRDVPGMWKMKQTGIPVVHSDITTIPGWSIVEQSQWIGSYIGAPIRRDNEVIGFLNVYSAQPGFFKEDHAARLQSFADQAAIAIRNAQLFAGEREQRALSEGLRATAEAINRTLEFDEVLDFVLDNTRHVVPHDAANIMLIEDGMARVVRGHGYNDYGVEGWVQQQRYRVDDVPDWKTMVETGRPFAIPDTQADANWLNLPEIAWIRSTVKAPIRVEGRVIGILHLDSATPGAYTQKHAERLQAFADQAAVALRNAQFFAAEHEQRTLAEALRATAEAINSTLDFDVVLERILSHVGRVVPYDVANVLLIEGDEVVLALQRAVATQSVTLLPETHRFKLAETSNLKHVFDTRAPLVIPHVHKYPGWIVAADQAWLQSQAAAPIILDDQVIGFLTLDSRMPDFYTQRHAERLQAFANQAAIAIRNAQLYAALQRQAAELEQRVEERTEELEQRRAQLQAILDAINEGVLYDEKTIVKYTNRAMKALTGFEADELVRVIEPLRSSRYTAEEFEALRQRIFDTVEEEGFWQGHAVLRRKDGTEFDAELTVTDVRNSDGDIVGAVTVIRDVSQERALQAQKDRFIASASHELRTPLTNFKTRLYLIEMQPKRASEHLLVLNQVARNMTELVENLLDVSRFERGVISLRLRPMVLQTLINEAVMMQHADADAKGVTLITDLHSEPLRVEADETRLKQVITNLIANAINYTQAGGTITVALQPDNEGHAIFAVRDTGIGIDAALLPQIFDPFFRANEEAAEGTGLGLTIAREIVQLHGGTIHAASVKGEGSTFTVKLDLLED